jgi:hypothetical protein
MSGAIEGSHDGASSPWIDISFKGDVYERALQAGGVELAGEVFRVLNTGSARARFESAVKLANAARKTIFRDCSIADWPIYNLGWEGVDEESTGLVAIGFLPNFSYPARIMTFIREKTRQPLSLCEIFLFTQPECSAVCPRWFNSHYRIAVEDHQRYREAVLKLVKSRGGFEFLSEHECFDPDSELIGTK